MNKTIVIFLSEYTTRQGGSATVIELGTALSEVGYTVHYLEVSFRIANVISHARQGILPSPFSKQGQRGAKAGVKQLISLMFRRQALQHIRTADFILVSYVVSPSFLANIRQHSQAKLILNHAASVDMNTPKMADYGTTYTDYCHQFARVLFQSAHDAHVSGLHNAVTLRPSVQPAKLATVDRVQKVLNPQDINLVWVGTLQPRKRPDLAIDVLLHLLRFDERYKLTLVGPTGAADYHEHIRQYATNAPPGRVALAGYRTDYLSFIAEADVVLQTSELEGVSRIMRESFSLAKLVATFRIQGTSEICTDENTLLADFGDTAALASRIAGAMTDEAAAAQRRHNAHQTFLRNYSWSTYRERARAIFAELAKVSRGYTNTPT